MSDPYLSRGNYQHNQQAVASQGNTYNQPQASSSFPNQSEHMNYQTQALPSNNAPPLVSTYQSDIPNPAPVSYGNQSQHHQQTFNQSHHTAPPYSNHPVVDNQKFVKPELGHDQR